MTEAAVNRIQEHFDRIRPAPAALAMRFYQLLFAANPELRALFPADLNEQYGHFATTLQRVIDNLGRIIVDTELQELGARHLGYGAQPQHYLAARDALVGALQQFAGADWNDSLARDWRLAINMVIIAMLRGAAIQTAALAQQLAAEDTIDGT